MTGEGHVGYTSKKSKKREDIIGEVLESPEIIF